MAVDFMIGLESVGIVRGKENPEWRDNTWLGRDERPVRQGIRVVFALSDPITCG